MFRKRYDEEIKRKVIQEHEAGELLSDCQSMNGRTHNIFFYLLIPSAFQN